MPEKTADATLRLLIAEDSEDDALLILRELRRGGYRPAMRRVDNAPDMRQALENADWDLIIADHNMPGFDSAEALTLARAHDPNIPFILVSGSIGEEIAVDAMKAGAHDYVMKDNLTRLLPAIQRELREAENRRDHQAAQARLHHLAFHDCLTGLANRPEFDRRLEQAVCSARDANQRHSLLFIDLDRFKLVNDSCGHLAGDEMLRRIARRLREGIRDSDHLARLGGDEFGVLLNNCSLERAERIAKQLLERLKSYTFVWGERGFRAGASIGLVEIDGFRDAHDLLSMADMACYAAKEHGRNRLRIYTEGNHELRQRRGEIQWLQRLQKAIADDSLELHHQPIRHLAGPLTHHEILLRLRDHENHLSHPDAFIPAAERYNLMPEIDRWTIRHAFTHLARRRHDDGLWLLNLSATSLSDEHLIDYIRAQLQTHALRPERIGFEITETAAIADFDRARELIQALRRLGCKVALDDFGTGMSSFSYLKSLEVDFIKIDGGFVRNMLHEPMDNAIVEAVNRIAHVSGIQTIAEFVESEAIAQRVGALNVDFAQGWAMGRPEPLTPTRITRQPTEKPT